MFACILLPNFRLQSALRWRDHNGSAVVVDEATPKGLVLEANATALSNGIAVGMTPAQAMARDGRVLIVPRSPAQEACANQLLVTVLFTIAPLVELTGDGLALASLEKIGRSVCWQQLADQLLTRLQEHGLAGVVGLAATPDLAHLAARGARPSAVVYDAPKYVEQLRIETLDLSEKLHLVLRDWGLRTLGDLQRLPKGQVVERLGAEAENLLKMVSARHKRPLRLVQTAPEYIEAFDFDYEVETLEPLLFLLRRFLTDLSERLQGVYRVARRLILQIPLDDGTCHERTFVIPAPTTEVEALFRILHTHLEDLQLPQKPIGLRLRIDAIEPARDQLQLFESALRDPNRFGETLARLKALLGNDAVGVPGHAPTHRPEDFELAESFDHSRPATISAPLLGLPLRRYRPAASGTVHFENERPMAVEFAELKGVIAEWAGPYRLSGDWWDRQQWETEEWDIAMAQGGLYRIARRGRTWRLEGCYELP